jgi:RNA polymerase sigma factor (sigma-70 family)
LLPPFAEVFMVATPPPDGYSSAPERLDACAKLLERMVRRLLPAQLRSKIDPEDVVQSAWLAVCRRQSAVDVFRSLELAERYLRTVTRNCLVDLIRHFRRASACEQALDGAADHLRTNEPAPDALAAADELWASMLAACPPEYQQILQMKRGGESLAEIACATGLHASSIRRILYRLAPSADSHAEDDESAACS